MKKGTFLKALFATFAMCLPIYMCVGQTVIQQGDAYVDNVYTYGDASCHDYDDNGPIVERSLDLKGFNAIQNSFSAKICYTPSRQYSVKALGSQKGIDMLDFTVKDGILYINIKKKLKGKRVRIHRGVTLYITSPELNSISNRGSLTLQGKHWKQDKLSIDNAGALTINVGVMECQALNIENRGSLSFTNGDVNATHVNLSNRGASTLDLSLSVKDIFELSNRGSCKFSGKVKAKTFIETCQGASTDNLDIAAETMELNIQGSGKINSTFKGNSATINGGGASNILLTVYCEKLSIESKGASKITVKGTADDTHLENHGVAKVDVSGLNQF